ncbi:hypothetical protein MBAV_005096, partial [Candidatus Magnetobacterium bavaricum]
MPDLVDGNVSVEFKKTCDASAGPEGQFTFELDSVRNNGKSSFAPVVDTAYLKLFPGYQSPQLWTNLGGYAYGGNGQDAVTEDITFVNSDSASMQGIPAGAVNWVWVGRTIGTASVTITGGEIKLSAKMTGVLHLSYQA